MMESFISHGITDSQIGELINYATTDPEVVRFTSDPERFKDRESFDRWREEKQPKIYTLTNNTGHLLGIIWFERKPLEAMPDIDNTFAIRVYGEARGKGLAYGFMEEAFTNYGARRFWLRVSADNAQAISLYTKFGFKQVSKPDRENKIVMIYERSA